MHATHSLLHKRCSESGALSSHGRCSPAGLPNYAFGTPRAHVCRKGCVNSRYSRNLLSSCRQCMLLIDVHVPSWMEAVVKLAHLSAPLHGAFSVDRLGGGSICNSGVFGHVGFTVLKDCGLSEHSLGSGTPITVRPHQ